MVPFSILNEINKNVCVVTKMNILFHFSKILLQSYIFQKDYVGWFELLITDRVNPFKMSGM